MVLSTVTFTPFINKYKTLKGSVFTHTSMSGGAYYVPGPDEDQLVKYYCEALRNGCKLSMTEAPRDILPILLDFDFHFPIKKVERQYTIEMIKDIVEVYLCELGKYVDLSDNANIIIMEKAHPLVDTKKKVVKESYVQQTLKHESTISSSSAKITGKPNQR